MHFFASTGDPCLKKTELMIAFELTALLDQHRHTDEAWSEFLRVPALSMGLYTLPAGSADLQHPHTEDEVYYVVSGRAQIRVGVEDRPVQPGLNRNAKLGGIEKGAAIRARGRSRCARRG